jgi:hypothetical protein
MLTGEVAYPYYRLNRSRSSRTTDDIWENGRYVEFKYDNRFLRLTGSSESQRKILPGKFLLPNGWEFYDNNCSLLPQEFFSGISTKLEVLQD